MTGPTAPHPDKNSIIVVSICAAFLPTLMASMVAVTLPTIGREFSLSAAAMSWIVNAYFLSIAAFLIPFGKAGDLYGRRNIFLYGIVLYTAAALLSGCAPGWKTLIIFRVLQGAGGSMIYGTGMAMLTSAVPARERGSMLGINVASTYTGLSIGPVLGGLLTQAFGWRSIFWVNVPVGLIIIFFLVWKVRRETIEPPTAGFDFGGAAVFAGSLVALMYGLSLLPLYLGMLLSAAGASGMVFFVLMESRTASPVLPLSLFKGNRIFILSNLAALLNYSAIQGALFLLSLYLQYTRGLSPKGAGLVLLSQPCIMAVLSPFAGKLSDRIEPRIVVSLGMSMCAAGLYCFSFITASTPFQFIVAGLVLLGAGVAFFSSPNTSAIMGSVEKKQYGTASSMVGTMRLTGAMLSMSIAALILAAFIGSVSVSEARVPQFVAAIKSSFLVFGSLCTLGIAASLARGRGRKKGRSETGQELLIE